MTLGVLRDEAERAAGTANPLNLTRVVPAEGSGSPAISSGGRWRRDERNVQAAGERSQAGWDYPRTASRVAKNLRRWKDLSLRSGPDAGDPVDAHAPGERTQSPAGGKRAALCLRPERALYRPGVSGRPAQGFGAAAVELDQGPRRRRAAGAGQLGVWTRSADG